MDQPFKHLKDSREAAEAAQGQREEAERQAREHEELLRQARRRTAAQYDEMVTRVLGFLREAAYPDLSLGGHSDGVWSIGYRTPGYVDYPGEEPTGSIWRPSVTVRLVFDEHNQPMHFRCDRPGSHYYRKHWLWGNLREDFEPIQCGLTEAELVEALRKLHPPDQ